MANDFFRVYKGISFTPRDTDPLNPTEGDVQFSDGTVRDKGLWEYKNGDWSRIGGGSSIIERNQVAHGFSLLEPIYHDGTNWEAADASDAAKLAEYVIIEVVDVDNFKAMKFGELELTGIATTLSLSIGDHYFLDDGGGYVSAEPSGFSAPVFYVESDDIIHIEVYRPASKGIAGSAIDLAWTAVVGDAADVTNGDATHSTIASAIASAVSGGRITLLSRIFTENLVITKEVHFFGSGAGSVINGTVQYSSGSSRSSSGRLKFGGNITVDNGVTKLILTNGWINNASTLTDNNASSAASLYTLVED